MKNRINKIVSFCKRNKWIIIILLLGIVSKLYKITSTIADLYAFRQTQTMGTIMEYYKHGINLLLPKMISMGNPGVLVLEFPIYQAIVAVILKLFGPVEAYARLVSIIFSTICVIFFYLLVNRLYSKKVALFSAFFLNFSPLFAFYSRVPMIEVFEIMLCIIFMYFFARWILDKKDIFLPMAVLFASLAVMVKPPYALPFFIPVVLLYVKERGFRFNYKFILSLVIPAVAMLLWLKYANYVNEFYNANEYPYIKEKPAIQMTLFPPNTWYLGTISQRLGLSNYVTIFTRIYKEILSFVGLLLMMICVFVRNKKHGLFWLSWLISVLIGTFAFFNVNIVHNYYQMPIVPVMAFYCGLGLATLSDKADKLFQNDIAIATKIIVVVILSLFIAGGINVTVKKGYYYEDEKIVTIGKMIKKTVAFDDKPILILTYVKDDHWDPSTLYFADKTGYVLPYDELTSEKMKYFKEKGVEQLVLPDADSFVMSGNIDVLSGYNVVNSVNRTIFLDLANVYNDKKTFSEYLQEDFFKNHSEIQLPIPSGQLEIGIEKMEESNENTNYIDIDGWAFFKDIESQEPKIYVVLSSDAKQYIFEAKTGYRPDISAYFKEDRDYSGFSTVLKKDIVENGDYKIGILIKDGVNEAFQYSDKTLTVSN